MRGFVASYYFLVSLYYLFGFIPTAFLMTSGEENIIRAEMTIAKCWIHLAYCFFMTAAFFTAGLGLLKLKKWSIPLIAGLTLFEAFVLIKNFAGLLPYSLIFLILFGAMLAWAIWEYRKKEQP